MNISVNPYHRSVVIDGEEVRQVVLPFPDYLNHLASVNCTYDVKTSKITDVQSVHRYVSHFIEKEYYYKHLPAFILWFNAEKQAQIAKEGTDIENLAEAISIYISPQLSIISNNVGSNNITKLYYNSSNKTINAERGDLTTLSATIPEVSSTVSGLMSSADILTLRELEIKSDVLFITEAELRVFELPIGSGLYPSLAGRTVVVS